jgi:uncharacterized membrane protein YhaH (DUF805 family)
MSVSYALFSFDGRLSCRDFWLKGFLILLPFSILNNIWYFWSDSNSAHVLSVVFGILLAFPTLALYVKRLHDHNRSGWFLATLLIPFLNFVFLFWIIIEIWFLRGTVGANRFGEDPTIDVPAGLSGASLD